MYFLVKNYNLMIILIFIAYLLVSSFIQAQEKTKRYNKPLTRNYRRITNIDRIIRRTLTVSLVISLSLIIISNVNINETNSFFIKQEESIVNVFRTGNWENPPVYASGTAWSMGERFGRGLARYSSYKKNSGTQQEPIKIPFVEGSNQNLVGEIHVWNNQNTLYIKVITNNPYKIVDSHLYMGLIVPINSAPGQLGLTQSSDPPVMEQNYDINYVYNEQTNPIENRITIPFSNLTNNTTIYIAIHALVRWQTN